MVGCRWCRVGGDVHGWVSNVGDQAAIGVMVTETVPVGSVFVAAGSDAWSCVDGAVGGTDCTLFGGCVGSGGGFVGFGGVHGGGVGSVPGGQVELDNDVTIVDDGANGMDLTPGDNVDDDQTPVTAAPVVVGDEGCGGGSGVAGCDGDVHGGGLEQR